MITEIDGPPRAYFVMYGSPILHPEGSTTRLAVRFAYKAIYSRSEDRLREFVEAVRNALEKEAPEGEGLIIWRRRVTKFEAIGPWSCRLETSPPLPDEFWKQFRYDDFLRQYKLDPDAED